MNLATYLYFWRVKAGLPTLVQLSISILPDNVRKPEFFSGRYEMKRWAKMGHMVTIENEV